MGKKNNVICSFLEEPGRFADFVNGSLYEGEQVVLACQVTECQTVYSINGKSRDVLKAVCNGKSYTVVGVENQDRAHYAMPLRCMEYDVLEYKRQLGILKAKYRQKRRKEKAAMDSAEFLSGIKKGDKLNPVTTIVFYHGKESYDGCINLHDMLDFRKENEIFRQYTADYHMNLVVLNELDEHNFRTGLRDLVGIVKRSHNKRELEMYCKENEQRLCRMDADTFDTVSTLIGRSSFMGKKAKRDGDGKIDMCKALRDLKQEGFDQGISQGIERGIEAFILDNLEEGIAKERIAQKLQRRFLLDEKEVQKFLGKYADVNKAAVME